MIKADLTTLITAFTNGGANTAAEFRAFQNAFLDSVYPTPIIQNGDSDDEILTPTDYPNRNYYVQFTKIGRRAFAEGRVRNNLATVSGTTNIATFLDSEYFPQSVDSLSNNYIFRGVARNYTTGEFINIIIDGGKLSVQGNFPYYGASGDFHFNLSYNTQD